FWAGCVGFLVPLTSSLWEGGISHPGRCTRPLGGGPPPGRYPRSGSVDRSPGPPRSVAHQLIVSKKRCPVPKKYMIGTLAAFSLALGMASTPALAQYGPGYARPG